MCGGKIYIKAKIGNIKEGVAFSPFGYGIVYHFPTNLTVSDSLDPISKEPDLKFSSIYIKAKSRKIAKLSEESINIVQQSYPKVKNKLYEVMLKLYSHLFDENPELESMFENDIKEIAEKQAEILKVYVENIENMENLNGYIDKIVKKHIEKKVQPQHYKLFGEAFIKSLSEVCKVSYAEKEAWKEIYNYLANLISAKERKIYEKRL